MSAPADFGWNSGGNWQNAAQNWGGAFVQDTTCEKLPCRFNDAGVCGYSGLGNPDVLNPTNIYNQAFGTWYWSQKSPSNLVVQAASRGDGEGKLPPAGGFVLAQGTVGSRFTKYCFRSPKFSGGYGNKLRLRYLANAPGTVIKICTTDQRSCNVVVTLPKDIVKTWQDAEVAIPFGATQVDICAFDLGAGFWVGVDNIRVFKNKQECAQK